jgi:hypothetical protein
MQLAVSYTKTGEITLMLELPDPKTAKIVVGYEPAKGENHRIMDVPKQFEGRPVTELARALRVNTKGAVPKLVPKA